MEKEAIAAKSILKALAGGTAVAGLTGGAGYLGHKIGYKGGATRATNEMASAFSEANTRENQQIADSFKLFNKKENAAIASNYMRRGMGLGAIGSNEKTVVDSWCQRFDPLFKVKGIERIIKMKEIERILNHI